jgi:hypothetical protein
VVEDFGGCEGDGRVLEELFEVGDSCFEVEDIAIAIVN